MKFSMTGQEKGDCLIEVAAQAGLTAYIKVLVPLKNKGIHMYSLSNIQALSFYFIIHYLYRYGTKKSALK